MGKKIKQDHGFRRAVIALLKIFLPFAAVFALAVGLIVWAKTRWTISLCSGLFFVGLALLAKPTVELLWDRIKNTKSEIRQTKRRFADR